MKMLRITVVVFATLLGAGLSLAADQPYMPKVPIKMRLNPFPLDQVRLLDGPIKAEQEKNRKYLLALDNDELLYTVRVNAGLPAPGKPLQRWEGADSEIRAHFLGHYLSACALMVQSTGDQAVRAKSATLVAELARCQAALGGGYLSAFPESHFDRLERGERVWAPYYVTHKMMAGLYDQYALCGNQQALEVLKGMAAYFARRTANWTPAALREQMDKNEEGGICEALWNLYGVTGDPETRALADKMEKRSFLDPLAVGTDNLARRHGNTHIPLVVGAMRRYELTGEGRYLAASTFFWDRVVRARSFATGGSTSVEHWIEPYELAHTLDNTNHETCKTHNMLKLTRHLLSVTGDPRYADFYERAFFNGILGTQGPSGGELEYYVPQATGYRRVFGTAMDSFWCCHGTGVESFAKLGDSIYFHDDAALYINLYIPSQVTWAERGVKLEQTGNFPETNTVRLVVHAAQPVRFALRPRAPQWLAGPLVARLNGKPLELAAAPGSFATIEREWHDGDRLELTFPMALHTEALPDDPQQVAVLYGPVVLAGIVGDALPGGPAITWNNVENLPAAERQRKIYFLADSADDTSWLHPVAGEPLTFQATGQPVSIVFKPFNRVVGERYGLYWPIIPAGSDRQVQMDHINEALAFLDRTTSDSVATLRPIFDRLKGDPLVADYHGRLQIAMAGVHQRAGEAMAARTLIEPYCEPFINRDQAALVFGVIGTPAPVAKDVRPLLTYGEGGDGTNQIIEREGRRALRTEVKRNKTHVYFTLPPNSPLRQSKSTITMAIDCYVEGPAGQKLLVEYDGDGPDGAYSKAPLVDLPAGNGWHQISVRLTGALFSGRQNFGADFRISGPGGEIMVGDVRLTADPQASGK
jgi:DUF1680 family protein